MVDGVAYSGIVREYQIYPQRAADYVLDKRVVNVTYAHPETRKPVEVALRLRPIRFTGTIPAPASELDPFLATSRLVLEQKMEGRVEELEVGDAIKRTISVSVQNLPAMFIPPLIPPLLPDGVNLPGLRAYPQSPLSEDLAGREAGRTTGRRTESVTYLIEEPGEYRLPALSVRWWNRRTGKIETTEAEAFAFQVPVPEVSAGGTDGEGAADTGGFGDRAVQFALSTAMTIALIALLWRVFRRRVRGLLSRWQVRRRRRAVSEPVRFRQLRRLARRGKPHDIYRALAVWLGSVDGPPVTMASLSGRPGCEPLAAAVATLGRALYAEEAADERVLSREARAALCKGLEDARRSIVSAGGSRTDASSLPSLNPSGAV